jgi:hypothetical protein
MEEHTFRAPVHLRIPIPIRFRAPLPGRYAKKLWKGERR